MHCVTGRLTKVALKALYFFLSPPRSEFILLDFFLWSLHSIHLEIIALSIHFVLVIIIDAGNILVKKTEKNPALKVLRL